MKRSAIKTHHTTTLGLHERQAFEPIKTNIQRGRTIKNKWYLKNIERWFMKYFRQRAIPQSISFIRNLLNNIARFDLKFMWQHTHVSPLTHSKLLKDFSHNKRYVSHQISLTNQLLQGPIFFRLQSLSFCLNDTSHLILAPALTTHNTNANHKKILKENWITLYNVI